ncbi:MAG: tRNA pseudouridine(55) synthase TruB [Gammaproteobacteria bacterium]
MGRKRKHRGRPVDGIVLLDKPSGITSNEALQQVKRLFQAQKAGHTGSLDKGATGLLPLCLGEATKFSAFLLEADKHYEAVCQLGAETTTGDAAGEIVASQPIPALTEQQIQAVLAGFLGLTQQVPPMYSAVKQNGQPLYKLAYQGKEVERQAREIRIDEIVLQGFTVDTLSIAVKCSKGTYIRTLAQDIGRELGCGAHVKSLRRLASGPFTAEQMISLPELQALAEAGLEQLDARLLPVDAVLAGLPEVRLLEAVAYYLCQGQAVLVPHAPTAGLVRLYDEDEQCFLGIGEVLEDGRIAPKRLLNR